MGQCCSSSKEKQETVTARGSSKHEATAFKVHTTGSATFHVYGGANAVAAGSEAKNVTTEGEKLTEPGQLRDGARRNEFDTISTEEIIKSTENIQLGDNIEILLEAFESLLRHDNSQKSTLMLITKFKDESTSLPALFHENHTDLKEAFEKFWEDFQLTLARQTYNLHADNNTETIRALARICAKLSTELLQRKEKSKTKPEEQKTFSSRARNVINMGEDFFSNKKPIHAILTFYMAAELHKLSNNGDDAIRGIRTCSYQTCLVVEEMRKEEEMKSVILDHVIPIMTKMTDFIDSMQNSNHTVRVGCKTWCLFRIGFCYNECGEYQQGAKVNENAIELMRTEFKEEANNYRIYGWCLNNAGVAYERMGNITKAIELFKMALEALGNATDYKTEEDKTEDIKSTENNLRILRKT